MIQLIEIREPQIEYENGIRRRAGTRNHDSIDSAYLKPDRGRGPAVVQHLNLDLPRAARLGATESLTV